jgi:hypothetical protein
MAAVCKEIGDRKMIAGTDSLQFNSTQLNSTQPLYVQGSHFHRTSPMRVGLFGLVVLVSGSLSAAELWMQFRGLAARDFGRKTYRDLVGSENVV